MKPIHVLLYYEFTPLKNLEALKAEHLDFCKSLGLRGKVLFGKEGINGSVSGTKEQVEVYKKFLKSKPQFKDLEFKEELCSEHPFNKLVCLIRPEIVAIGQNLDLTNRGSYIEPSEFLELYNSPEIEDTLVLDTRNDYESAIGHFDKAVKPKIKTFKEFPEYVDSLDVPKDKPIVMYCTGGIRCEKASACMIEKGFTNVKQLHGGIIKFYQKHPGTIWKGKCMVFDKRMVTSPDSGPNALTSCTHCEKSSDLYRNCANPTCNKKFIICAGCQKEMNACCSQPCLSAFLALCKQKEIANRGKSLKISAQ